MPLRPKGSDEGPDLALWLSDAGEGKPAELSLVLVVDDFTDAREMLVDYMEWAGYRTTQASYGQEAIEKAMRFLPHLILMDLALPGVDGWEAIRRLRGNRLTRLIPIVAVSAHVLPEDVRRAWEAGCDGFITKPVNPERLLALVSDLLGGGPD